MLRAVCSKSSKRSKAVALDLLEQWLGVVRRYDADLIAWESPVDGAENDVERALRKALPKPPDTKPLIGGLGHLLVGRK